MQISSIMRGPYTYGTLPRVRTVRSTIVLPTAGDPRRTKFSSSWLAPRLYSYFGLLKYRLFIATISP
jgi:hypothetical protein